ncbi:MAG TPA: hypothetical protein VIM06_08440 [Rhodanobacter sp.]
MSVLSRLPLASIIVGLLLAGCAHQPTSHPTAVKTTASSRTVATPSSSATTADNNSRHQHHATVTSSQTTADTKLPDSTGIAACDDYLSSYLACHRAAQIFPPDQLPKRYQAMRTSLLRDSQNPDIRPQLATRCNSLATSLREALHGKACAVEPASAGTSP